MRLYLVPGILFLVLIQAGGSPASAQADVWSTDWAKSGLITFAMEADTIDFSEWTDTCWEWRGMPEPAGPGYDLVWRYDSLRAPQGIQDIATLVPPLAILACDRLDSVRKKIDTLLDQRSFRPPLDFIPARRCSLGHWYSLKTAEGGLVLLANVGYYIGGIDRTQYFWGYTAPTGVQRRNDPANAAINLDAFPNPFQAQTVVTYQLPAAGTIRIQVYDLQGKCVARLAEGRMPAGRHRVIFDGRGMPGGVYIVQQTGEGGTVAVRIILMN